MSHWSHNIEKMDEIIEKNLPELWKQRIKDGDATLDDVPADIQCEALAKGEPDYWGGKIDEAHEKGRDRQMSMVR